MSKATLERNKNAEFKEKVCKVQKEAQNRPEVIERKSKSHKGKMWIYSPEADIEKAINKDDPIPQGYRRGRKRKK